MPTYEYRCHNCGYRFELAHDMNDDPHPKCPHCNGTVQRLIGAGIGVIIKGGNNPRTGSSVEAIS